MENSAKTVEFGQNSHDFHLPKISAKNILSEITRKAQISSFFHRI
jgi:hypothetical protein